MNSSDEQRLTQWLDGELTDDEVRDLLQQDSTLLELREASRSTGALLRQALPPVEVPYGDFFNNQIRQRAEAETQVDTRLANSAQSFVSHLMNILTSPRWAAGLAVGAAGLLMFTLIMASSGLRRYSEVVDTYAPRPGIVATTDYNEDAGVTIIKIDGLPALSQTASISGYFPASSERDRLMASTTLYNAEHKPILVVSTGAQGQPVFRSFSH